jgi:predicted AAA+ superfamily ATPase
VYYIKRLIENKITNKLENFGAICITGPKFCGKTTTSEKFARSAIYLKESEQILNKVLFDNKTALIGDRPHLIDE